MANEEELNEVEQGSQQEELSSQRLPRLMDPP